MRGAGNATVRAASAVVGAVLFLLVSCAPAVAAYPGTNGKIAFSRDGQIWTIDPDGTNETQLTTVSPSYDPQWSPKGTRIAYTRGFGTSAEVRIMDADGSNDVQVRDPWAFSPTWSPNGRRVAFIAPYYDSDCPCYIYVIVDAELDGSQPRYLHSQADFDGSRLDDISYSPRGDYVAVTNFDGPTSDRELYKVSVIGGGVSGIAGGSSADQWRGGWSPSADQLAYLDGLNDYSVATISPDGTGRTVLVPDAFGVEWSPDATKLVFAGRDGACGGCLELQLMNPDGTGLTTITHTTGDETDPDWQPVMGAPIAGYPRPKGATPLRVSLVPAFDQCTAPNRAHGPPLAFGSCNPPVQSAPDRTVGTPDANGAVAKMAGSVRVEAMLGNPATAADEADVAVSFSVTDIRCRPGLNAWPCSELNSNGDRDYEGELTARMSARLTDKYNVPAPGGISPGTMTDQLISVDATCTGTTDQSVGSTCGVSTTLDALIPGMVSEGDRAVMELGQVEVADAGQGDLVLLRQGVFVP